MGVTPIGYAEVTAVFDIPGDAGPANVVLGHDVSAHSTLIPIIQAVAGVWQDDPGIMDVISSQITLSHIITRWQAQAGDPIIATTTLNEDGRQAGGVMSPQVTLLAHKVSEFGGRKNRGRTFFPGAIEDGVDNGGFIIGQYGTDYLARVSAMLAQFAAADVPMVILHTSPADTPTPVAEFVGSLKVATQRRRLR